MTSPQMKINFAFANKLNFMDSLNTQSGGIYNVTCIAELLALVHAGPYIQDNWLVILNFF